MTTKKELIDLAKVLGINDPSLKNKNKDIIKSIINEFKQTKNKSVLAQGKTVTKIFHSADIHIRTLDRHKEYNHVFNNLYEKLKLQDDLDTSVFVICGDLFHNRDRLTSETIILFNEFIDQLTSIIDVIIILGNHDTFTHTDRLDVLTGIVSLKVSDLTKYNFYFLKYSGIYSYHNINFYVSSLLDNKFLRCPKDSDEINIALYHGPVQNCKLDNDYIYTGSDTIKLVDFNFFDYVLLGDIHKKQFLKENIAYPGSLIQQNHKEENIHGILSWDLINKKCDFIEVESDYGFRTITLNDLENIEILEDLPKFSYIRLIHNYLDIFDINKIKEKISKYTEIVGFTKIINGNEIKENNEVIISEDLMSINIIKAQALPDSIKEEIIQLHNKQMELYSDNLKQNKKGNSWYIESIEFTNMFIYGNDNINKIEFKDGITGILGNNAIGKSAILNIIMYCLFGNIFKSKNYSNRNIINKNAKNYYVKMIIISGPIKYIIYRKGTNKKRTNGELSMKEELVITEEKDNKITNLTDSTKSDTSKKIYEILNLSSKESFILTNVLSYTNYITLLNMTNSDISSKLNELFDLSKYSDVYSIVLKQYKKITNDILNNESRLTELKKQIKNIQEINPNKLNQKQTELSNLQKQLDELNEQEIELGKIPILTPTDKNEFDLTNELNQIGEIAITRTKQDIKNEIKTIKIDNSIKSIKTNKSIEELKTITYTKVPIRNIVSETEYQDILNKEQFSVDVFIEDLEKCDGKCDQELYKDLMEFLKTLNSKDYLNDSIKLIDYSNYKKDIEYNKNIQKKLDTINGKIKYVSEKLLLELMSELKIAELQEKKVLLTKELQDIKEYKCNEEKIKIKENIRREKDIVNSKIKKINNEIIDIKAEIKDIENKMNENIKIDKNCKEINEKITISKKEENLYKLYKDIVKDLPKKILTDTLKKIEIDVNKKIYSFTGLYILFDRSENTLDSKSNWEIVVKKNNITLGTEHLSGYERFIVNTFLKITLDKYKFYDKGEIFIIDECFDAVSEENFHNISSIFDILRKEYKTILIVSHNEELKKMVDHRINIETDYLCSRIKEN